MKKRQTNRIIAARKDNQGRLLCLVPICNNFRAAYANNENRFRNYCKDHHFTDMWEYTSWRGLRSKALKRDNNTCVKCGDNQEEILIKAKVQELVNIDGVFRFEIVMKDTMASNFIVDHIKPIALDGDEWDINNLQTLCRKCNVKKTALDLMKIAHARREEKKPDKQQYL